MRVNRADARRIEVDAGALEGALRVLRHRSASLLFQVRRRQFFITRTEQRRAALRRARKKARRLN
jgi:ribosomal protein S21